MGTETWWAQSDPREGAALSPQPCKLLEAAVWVLNVSKKILCTRTIYSCKQTPSFKRNSLSYSVSAYK